MKERIEEYINGTMSMADKETFEKLMAEDPELTSMVNNYSSLRSVSEGALEMKLLNEIEMVSGKKKVKKGRMNKYSWIGLLFLAIAVLLTMLYLNENTDEQRDQIFAANYERPIDEDIKRSADDESLLSDYEEAKYQFSLNEWDKSIVAWEKVINNSQNQDTISNAYYFIGHIYLNQYEFNKSKTAFAKSQREEIPRYLELIEKLEE